MKPKAAASRPKVVSGKSRPDPGASGRGSTSAEHWPAGRPIAAVVAVAVALAAVGAAVGVFSAFAHAQRIGNVAIGVPVTIAAHAAIVVVCGVLARSRLAAGLPGLGWMISVLVFAQPRSEGDLVVAADGPGLSYLLAGLVVLGGLSAVPYHRFPDRLGTTGRGSR